MDGLKYKNGGYPLKKNFLSKGGIGKAKKASKASIRPKVKNCTIGKK